MRRNMPTSVAFGCHLNSVVDQDHFLILLSLGSDTDEIRIIGARNKDITRGENDKTTLMKNCSIVRVRIGGTVATVKIFKQYFHFCKTTQEQAEEIATFLCAEMVALQKILGDRQLLASRVDELIDENNHIPHSQREEIIDYFEGKSVCSLDLEHDRVTSTMTTHTVKLGSKIHTARLVRMLRDEKQDSSWTITFDNALSLAIRIVITVGSDKKYSFAIQPTGSILYSANEETDEALSAQREVIDFVRSKYDLIKWE